MGADATRPAVTLRLELAGGQSLFRTCTFAASLNGSVSGHQLPQETTNDDTFSSGGKTRELCAELAG